MRSFLSLLLFVAFLTSPAQAMKVQVVESSGLTAWLIEEKSVPAFQMRITFRESGAAYDPSGKEGLAVLASTLMNEGAGPYNSTAFQQELERHAIRLYGSADEDGFSVSLESLSDQREKALALMALALTKPRFEAEPLARMRAELISGLKRMEESPAYVAARAWYKAAFGDHPYGRPTRGTPESLAGISKADLVAFARRSFSRDKMLIAVAGDVSAQDLKGFLDMLATALPEKAAKGLTLTDVTVQGGEAPIRIEKQSPQTVVMLGLPGILRKDPNFFPAYVLNYALGGGELNSRLMQALRHEKGLVYSISSDLDSLKASSLWMASFSSSNATAEEALQLTLKTLHEVAEKGLTEQELSETKAFLKGSFPLNLDSNESLVGYLILMQHYGLGTDYLDTRNSYIEAVTAKQVQAVAKRLFENAKPQIVMVGGK
jgi:zinc protease